MKDIYILAALLFISLIFVFIGLVIFLIHFFAVIHTKIRSSIVDKGTFIKNGAVIKKWITALLSIVFLLLLLLSVKQIYSIKTGFQATETTQSEESAGGHTVLNCGNVFAVKNTSNGNSIVYTTLDAASYPNDITKDIPSLNKRSISYGERLNARVVIIFDYTNETEEAALIKIKNRTRIDDIGNIYKKEREILLYTNEKTKETDINISGLYKKERLRERLKRVIADSKNNALSSSRIFLNEICEFSKNPYLYTFIYSFSFPWLLLSCLTAILFSFTTTSLLIVPADIQNNDVFRQNNAHRSRSNTDRRQPAPHTDKIRSSRPDHIDKSQNISKIDNDPRKRSQSSYKQFLQKNTQDTHISVKKETNKAMENRYKNKQSDNNKINRMERTHVQKRNTGIKRRSTKNKKV